jgi:hypothetical protein
LQKAKVKREKPLAGISPSRGDLPRRQPKWARLRQDFDAAILFGTATLCGDVWRTVRRRAFDAGIETAISCQSPGTTGFTDYLTNDGGAELAQSVAWHSNAKTTGCYDRRNDDSIMVKLERIGI